MRRSSQGQERGAATATALLADRPVEGLCILVRTVSGYFRVAIEPAGTSWKSVPDLKVRSVPAHSCQPAHQRVKKTLE